MQFTIIQTQYSIGQEPVTVVTRHPLGLRNVSTTQADLTARTAGGAGIWGDAEVLAEVQAQLDADPALVGLDPVAVLYVAPNAVVGKPV